MRMHVRARIVVFTVGAVSLGGCANTPSQPESPAVVIGFPAGWQGTVGATGQYEIGLHRVERHGGRSAAYIDGPLLFTTEVGILEQPVRADNYLGKRVRLSAWVKGRGIAGPIAGLWMRVDGAGVVTAYDNMSNRPEHGTTDWHEVSIVLDVPSDALGIVIGAMLQGGGTLGSGTLFIDDMKLETVPNSVPSTNMFAAPKPNSIDPATTMANYLHAATSPTNVDFEQSP